MASTSLILPPCPPSFFVGGFVRPTHVHPLPLGGGLMTTTTMAPCASHVLRTRMLLPRGRFYKARLNSSNRSFVPHYPSHYRYPSITTPRQILFLALCGGSDGVTRESREDVEHNNNLSNRENVVVVGASLAGLLVAVAFARAGYYAKVIEKDDDEEDGCSNSNSNNNIDIDNGQRTALARLRRTRAGTPQARHVHTLLAGGACALDELLPGVLREIEHQHAVKADLTKIFHVNVDGQWLPSSDEGVRSDTVLCSRPLLEATVRSRVLQMPGISIESGCNSRRRDSRQPTACTRRGQPHARSHLA